MKKFQKILFYTILIYALIGFFIIPFVVKSQLIKVAQDKTDATLSIDTIAFNPFIFQLSIKDIKLTSLDNKPLVSLKSLFLNIELVSLFDLSVHVKKLILQEPKINLVYEKNKTFNILNIIKQSTQNKDQNGSTNSNIPRVIVDTFKINDGNLHYDDFTHKSSFEFSFDNIKFELKDIDTKDLNSSDASMRFYAKIADGGSIEIKTQASRFKPLVLDGNISLNSNKIYTQWRYFQDSLNLEATNGEFSLYGQYHLNFDDLNATSLENVALSLKNVRIKPKGKYKDILNMGSFSITQASIQPMQKNVYIKKIALNALLAKIKRTQEGKIDWLDFVATKKAKEKAMPIQKQKILPWKVLADEVSLTNIQAEFDDNFVKPKVVTKLNKLNLEMKHVTLSGKEPLNYHIDLNLNKNMKCTSKGDVKYKVLDLQTQIECEGFDITYYTPYIEDIARKNLKSFDLDLKSGLISFRANTKVRNSNGNLEIAFNDSDLNFKNVSLYKKSTQEKLLSFNTFDLNKIDANTKEKSVTVEKINIHDLDIEAKRLKNADFNVENLLSLKEKKEVQEEKKELQNVKEEKQYTVLLKQFSLSNAVANFDDRFLKSNTQSAINKIFLTLYNVENKKDAQFQYEFACKVNDKGEIESKGIIGIDPFIQNGTLDIKNVSLQEFTPYIEENSYLHIDDGKISLQSKTKYEKSTKNPDFQIDGTFKIEELFINDSRDNSSLLSFNNLALKSFDLELSPNRLFVNEVNLNAFYVNAVIDQNKMMNFASLVKNTTKSATSGTIKEDKKQESFPVKVMKLSVANGSAQFADYSLPIQFQTNIHDVNGQVYLISNQSDETSYMNVGGDIDNYGSANFEGSINIATPKIYTDLNLDFKNLELNSLNGYSVSFAGYKLDEGRLYLDLNYNIVDAKLLGKNNIVIKKIKLGEKFHDNNSSLPLGLAIALLEDGDGLIDLDIPVKGDVNKPDFEYSTILTKALSNLVLNAIASPFKFLSSLVGISSNDLESLDFKSGLSNILAPQKEKLDKIAKMIQKRPKIYLTIQGTYDLILDKHTLQREKLLAAVMQKTEEKNQQTKENLMTKDILEDIYYNFRNDEKLKLLKEKLKSKYNDKALEREYLAALLEECTSIQEISLDTLKSLATQRAQNIREYLVLDKGIDRSRIIIQNIMPSHGKNTKMVQSKLELEVKSK